MIMSGSSQRCWSSSLASADLCVMLSCYLITLKASRSSPWTVCRFLLSTRDLKVSSLIQRLSSSCLAKITSLFVQFGLWKFILSRMTSFSDSKLQFLIVRMWKGTKSYFPCGSFTGQTSVDAALSQQTLLGCKILIAFWLAYDSTLVRSKVFIPS